MFYSQRAGIEASFLFFDRRQVKTIFLVKRKYDCLRDYKKLRPITYFVIYKTRETACSLQDSYQPVFCGFHRVW